MKVPNPVTLQWIIRLYWDPSITIIDFAKSDSDAEALKFLIRNGMVDGETDVSDAPLERTERLKAFVDHLLQVPLPEHMEQWVSPIEQLNRDSRDGVLT